MATTKKPLVDTETGEVIGNIIEEHFLPEEPDQTDEPEALQEISDQTDEEMAEKKLAPDIDPSRLIYKDGELSAIAPDPDCEMCSGEGGWDAVFVNSEGPDTQEWTRCECIEIPG